VFDGTWRAAWRRFAQDIEGEYRSRTGGADLARYENEEWVITFD
jgi:hypothetical protein